MIRRVDVDDLTIEPLGPNESPETGELLALYDAVGWTAYTREPKALRAAVAGSSFVVTARRGPRLVGLARAISDGVSDCYLQDVLVAPDQQRLGIGRALVEAVLARYSGVRRKVLLTDDEPRQKAFYESLGCTDIRDISGGPIRVFVRFDGWGQT
jgi:GNAT superfamily N-acetyltransferase